jgi:hypothetical protein
MATRKEMENAISHFKIKANQLVYPQKMEFGQDGEIHFHGLTKREYFAAMAMQGEITCQHDEFTGHPDTIAIRAVQCADALLAELEKTEKQ